VWQNEKKMREKYETKEKKASSPEVEKLQKDVVRYQDKISELEKYLKDAKVELALKDTQIIGHKHIAEKVRGEMANVSIRLKEKCDVHVEWSSYKSYSVRCLFL
jgi:uncharacterized protein YlxW (UPF0749 family)